MGESDELGERIATLIDDAMTAAHDDKFEKAFMLISIALRCAVVELYR